MVPANDIGRPLRNQMVHAVSRLTEASGRFRRKGATWTCRTECSAHPAQVDRSLVERELAARTSERIQYGRPYWTGMRSPQPRVVATVTRWHERPRSRAPGAVASIGSISDVASGISRFFKDPLGTASKQTAEQIRCAGMNKPAWNTSLNERELKDTPTALLGAFSYTEYIPHIQKILTGQQLIADFGYDSDYDPVLQAGCR